MTAKELFFPIDRKIYKTGQTRGADDDVIFQNRVNRNSTVLIPFRDYELFYEQLSCGFCFENGYIVLISPDDYFSDACQELICKFKLRLGYNLLVFYETRKQWNAYPVPSKWKPAMSRTAPLKGQYVARVPRTTSKKDDKINLGYNQTKMKGAGIRVYEYADTQTINLCKLQLEYLFWSCHDIDDFISLAGTESAILEKRRSKVIENAKLMGVADFRLLREARIVDAQGFTVCPLCLERMSALTFASKMSQARGREVPDLTVTDNSLFHIEELRMGKFNHKLYNLGWGHHYCNVTIADRGVEGTLQWMHRILEANQMI